MSGDSQAYRVLLVEDDPSVRSLLVRLLGRRFDVVAAAEATEALRLMVESGFDMVVSDYQMPGRDGVWLLGEVSSKYPSTRRVLISGIVADEFQRHIDSGLVHLFLQKPLEPESVSVLQAVLKL